MVFGCNVLVYNRIKVLAEPNDRLFYNIWEIVVKKLQIFIGHWNKGYLYSPVLDKIQEDSIKK